MSDAHYYPTMPRDSLMLVRLNIEPGETVTVSSGDLPEWYGGPYFMPKHFIYVGHGDLWLLRSSRVKAASMIEADQPCETYRLPAPTFVNWPVFGVLAGWGLELQVMNRGEEIGHLIARLAGEFQDPALPPEQRKRSSR